MVLPINLRNLIITDPAGNIVGSVVGIRLADNGQIEVDQRDESGVLHRRIDAFGVSLRLAGVAEAAVPQVVRESALIAAKAESVQIASFLHPSMLAPEVSSGEDPPAS